MGLLIHFPFYLLTVAPGGARRCNGLMDDLPLSSHENTVAPADASRAIAAPGQRVAGPRPTPEASSHHSFAAAAGLFLLCVLAYFPLHQAGFIWDDDSWLRFNSMVHHWRGLWYIWFVPHASIQYYPLLFTALLLQYKLWGLQALGYHLVNIGLQAMNAILLWRILRQLQLRSAWIAAAIWAIHPVQVETVGWIVEQKSLLSGLFYFAAALAWLRFAGWGVECPGNTELGGAAGDSLPHSGASWRTGIETRCGLHPRAASERGGATLSNLKVQRSHRQSTAWYLLATFCFVLALLAKTYVCTLPAALLVVLWWRRGYVARREVLSLIPWFAMVLAAALVTVFMERTGAGASGRQFIFTFRQHLVIAGQDLWFYPWKLFWPHPLLPVYLRWRIHHFSNWQWIFPISVFLLPVVLLARRRKIGRAPFAAVAFYGLTISPALGFISFAGMTYTFVTDHYQYLACIGLIVLVTEGFWFAVSGFRFLVPGFWWKTHPAAPQPATGAKSRYGANHKPETGNPKPQIPCPKPIALACGGVVLVALGVLTWRQGNDYVPPIHLWYHEYRYDPQSWVAREQIGMHLLARGKVAEAYRWIFHAYTLTGGSNPVVDGNLGEISARYFHDDAAAIGYYRRSLQADPWQPDIIIRLAACYERQRNWAMAFHDLRHGLALMPRSGDLHFALANALRMGKHYRAAAHQYRLTLHSEPYRWAAIYRLAEALEAAGQWSAALPWYARVVRLDPHSGLLHFSYGRCLLEAKQTAKAVRQLRQALSQQAEAPGHAAAYRLLARAYQRLGRRKKAAAALAHWRALAHRRESRPR